jgi:hypothetical protein
MEWDYCHKSGQLPTYFCQKQRPWAHLTFWAAPACGPFIPARLGARFPKLVLPFINSEAAGGRLGAWAAMKNKSNCKLPRFTYIHLDWSLSSLSILD